MWMKGMYILKFWGIRNETVNGLVQIFEMQAAMKILLCLTMGLVAVSLPKIIVPVSHIFLFPVSLCIPLCDVQEFRKIFNLCTE